VHIHRFETIRVGPIVVHDVPIVVLAKDPPPLGGGRRLSDALIGQDILGRGRLWFAFSTDRLFISIRDSTAATTGH
jgi:hypothetical protein